MPLLGHGNESGHVGTIGHEIVNYKVINKKPQEGDHCQVGRPLVPLSDHGNAIKNPNSASRVYRT